MVFKMLALNNVAVVFEDNARYPSDNPGFVVTRELQYVSSCVFQGAIPYAWMGLDESGRADRPT